MLFKDFRSEATGFKRTPSSKHPHSSPTWHLRTGRCLKWGCKELKPVNPKGNQSWIFIGRTDAKAEAPILWPPAAKSWLIRKDPDAGEDWRQKKKRMAEDEMARTFCDRRVRQPHHKNRRASASQWVSKAKRTQGTRSPGSKGVPLLLGLQEGVRAGLLAETLKGWMTWEAAKHSQDERDLGWGEMHWAAPPDEGPGDTKLHLPGSAHQVLPGLALRPPPAAAARPPSPSWWPLALSWGQLHRTAGGRGFITTLPAPAPKNNLKLLKSPQPPAADSGPTALGVRDLSDEQRTSASSGPPDRRPSSRPPSSSAGLPGSAPLCGYTRDPSSLCSAFWTACSQHRQQGKRANTQNEALKGNAKQTVFQFFTRETPAHCRNLCIHVCACLLAKPLQSCPTFCHPMGYSLPGFSVHGILQTRMLEWVAIPSTRG